MIVHIKQIDPSGTHLAGTEQQDILVLEEPGVRPLSMVEYDIDVGMSGGGLYATGTLGLKMEFECVRCLQKFPQWLEIPDFSMHTELSGNETVDLTPHMREDILLALPAHPHCDDAGDRECSQSSTFNDGDAGSENESGGSSAWDILDKLNK